jgi:hypothetical protein
MNKLNYNHVMPGVTIWYNKNESKRKNAKVKESIGWTLKKVKKGWLSTNINEDLFIVNESNFLAWRESKCK